MDKGKVKLGIVIGAVSMLLAWIFKTLLAGTGAVITFATYDINVRQQLESGIATTSAGGVAEKILSVMGGVIPAAFQQYLLVGLAGFLMVLVGGWVSDMLKIKAENKLWMTMLVGTVALTVFIKYTSVLTLAFVPTLVGLAIYFAIVTFVIQFLSKQNWLPKDWV